MGVAKERQRENRQEGMRASERTRFDLVSGFPFVHCEAKRSGRKKWRDRVGGESCAEIFIEPRKPAGEECETLNYLVK